MVLRGQHQEIVAPWTNAMTVDSVPVRYSSTTTFFPRRRNAFSTIICRLPFKRFSTVSATMTPLPSAKPSALMTIGAPCFTDVFCRFRFREVSISRSRHTIRYINSLANVFAPFDIAAALSDQICANLAPQTRRRALQGFSGPTIVKSIPVPFANSPILQFPFIDRHARCEPSIPDCLAREISVFGIVRVSHARYACSRPPRPTTNTFIVLLFSINV